MTDDGRGGERPGTPEGGAPGGITCEEALAKVYEYLDGEIDPETQARIHEHLEVCRRCYPYFNFERLFLDYVRERASGPAQSEELERKVRELIEREEET